MTPAVLGFLGFIFFYCKITKCSTPRVNIISIFFFSFLNGKVHKLRPENSRVLPRWDHSYSVSLTLPAFNQEQIYLICKFTDNNINYVIIIFLMPCKLGNKQSEPAAPPTQPLLPSPKIKKTKGKTK